MDFIKFNIFSFHFVRCLDNNPNFLLQLIILFQKIIFFSKFELLADKGALLVGVVNASPNADRKKENDMIEPLGIADKMETVRQLSSSSIPIASTGLASGAANGQPLQSAALMQQLQTALQSNPTGAMAELEAQNQESTVLQAQNQQQTVLAAIQAQQQQMAAAQYALAGSFDHAVRRLFNARQTSCP